MVLLAFVPSANAAKTNHADLHLSGFGWLGDLQLKRQIRLMQPGQQSPVIYDASQIEDIVLILLAKLETDGYLEPRVTAQLTFTNGTTASYSWDRKFETVLPGSTAATDVRMRVERGVRFYYNTLEIEGLDALSVKHARDFFVFGNALFRFKGTRVYSPRRLSNSMDDLRDALSRRGYQNATVTVSRVERNLTNGAVDVAITVKQGLPSFVRSVDVKVFSPQQAKPVRRRFLFPDTPYSRVWEQDFDQELLTNEFMRGFPDAHADLSVLQRRTNQDNIQLELEATVHTETNITVGAVRFEGDHSVRPGVLHHFLRFKSGQPLNRIETDDARERLARLGVFDSVEVRYEPVDPHTRDVVYDLKKAKSFDVNLLFGYGSYDLLGGGVELEHHNVFGLAHDAKLTALQTFKSTLADFRYTMPEAFGSDLDVFLSSSLLRREEISFTREEYGGAAGLHHFFSPIQTDVSLRYDYQFLNAESSGLTVDPSIGVGNANASSIVLDLKRDLRDNPLAPKAGYDLFVNAEAASAALGGDVTYQRILLGGSVHVGLGGGRFLHLGATHGVTFTFGSTDTDLPFNKRFFPGGDNSVRGYQRGEAAPRNSSGDIIGAETYLQGNVELEQFLTRTISVVAFVDGVGFAAQRRDYPFNEGLFSAGGGLRWKTPIGPVRLEYGHNLNPRPGDPEGTVQFALGFPF